jgi:GTP-binding protein Era
MHEAGSSEEPSEAKGETRAGHVALVGRPNVGKSTLLNALMGEKLSIVSHKAQTTRDAVTGILTVPGAQLIFVDTPGLLEPRYALQRSMLDTALRVLNDADVVLLLLDASRPAEVPAAEGLERLRARADRLVVAINKVDIAGSDGVKELASWTRRELKTEATFLAAATGEGVETLRDRILERLPPNPFFYPEDELAVQPVRFFVAELVRETIFEEYEQEVPYSTVVRIEEFREESDPLFIRATIYVERDSQKAILIGQAGAAIKQLGARAREKIEAFVGTRVYLDLWVKALPGWRRKVSSLRYLGYAVAADATDEGGSQEDEGEGSSSGAASSSTPGEGKG